MVLFLVLVDIGTENPPLCNVSDLMFDSMRSHRLWIHLMLQSSRLCSSHRGKIWDDIFIYHLGSVVQFWRSQEPLVYTDSLLQGDPDTVSKALSIAKTGIVINSSINFCLYCLSGKKFRKELRLLLSPCIHISDGTESKRMLPLSSGSSSGSFVKTKSTLWDTSRATKTLWEKNMYTSYP